MVAVACGKAAPCGSLPATLDRYLNSIHQPQICGTQFYFKPKEPTTQELYNRNLVPDALRSIVLRRKDKENSTTPNTRSPRWRVFDPFHQH